MPRHSHRISIEHTSFPRENVLSCTTSIGTASASHTFEDDSKVRGGWEHQDTKVSEAKRDIRPSVDADKRVNNEASSPSPLHVRIRVL